MVVILHELPPLTDPKHPAREFYTVEHAENELIDEGNDLTRAFFAAAKLGMESIFESDNNQDLTFLAVLHTLSRRNIVLLSKVDHIDDVIGMGAYSDAYPGVVLPGVVDLTFLAVHPQNIEVRGMRRLY